MAYTVHQVEGDAQRIVGSGPLVVWNSLHCPYANRLMLALATKKVPYERRDIDAITLYTDKPKEFLEVNPKGMVPAVNDNGKYLYESLFCVEYIDEIFEASSKAHILPEEPYKRYLSRQLVDEVSKALIPSLWHAMLPSTENRDEYKTKCLQFLSSFFQRVKEVSDGPFFGGATLGYVDIALIPFIQRTLVLDRLYGFTVPETDEYLAFHNWWKEVQKTDAFKSSSQSVEYIVESRKIYLEQKGLL